MSKQEESSQTNMQSNTGFVLKRTIVLVGMMGSGKSAIGRSLSARLKVPLLDSDAEIEKAANTTISEIFSRDGETFFRERETEIIARLLDGPPAILSTGGGAFLSKRNRQIISQQGVSIWLDVGLETLWERVRNKDTRPLLRTRDPYGTLRDLLEVRIDIYRRADLSVKAKRNYSIDQTTNRVLEALCHRPDVLEMQN